MPEIFNLIYFAVVLIAGVLVYRVVVFLVDSPLHAWLIRVEVAEKLIAAFKREGIRTHSFDVQADAAQMPGSPRV